MTDEVCENCGSAFGKLETPNVWDGHVVCDDCLTKLEKRPPKTSALVSGLTAANAPPPAEEVVLLTVKPDVSGQLILGAVLLIFIIGIFVLIGAMQNAAAELVVTSRRVRIRQPGFNSRSIEIPLDKITAVEVSGSVGQLGSITIIGAGLASVTFQGLNNPEKVRATISAAADAIGRR